MRVAVLVDAAFFHRRYKALVPGWEGHTGQHVAEQLHQWACAHVRHDALGKLPPSAPVELYRIFVYDCAPFTKKMHHPLTKRHIDFAKTDLATFKRDFLQRLPQLRKVALRLGHLSEIAQWKIKESVLEELLKGRKQWGELDSDDVTLDVKQKGVDMRIGVDVASLAYKRQVDRIVLVAGDADFVPAAKLARREGIDFVLDSMHSHIHASLYEHIDGLTSMAPRPATAHGGNGQPAKDYGLSHPWGYGRVRLSSILGPLNPPPPTADLFSPKSDDGATAPRTPDAPGD